MINSSQHLLQKEVKEQKREKNSINNNNFLLIMKKNLVYAMMSAIALTSAVSFTGCASDDSTSVDTNPTYDGTSVRTDFAFSISSGKIG